MDLSRGEAKLSDGVFSWRTFKARKGSFEEMLRLSQVYIWPFYEKIGARNIAFWLETPLPGEPETDVDTIHMITHYESFEHWEATREPWARGEDDETFLRMANAMFQRSSFVIEESQRFVTGFVTDNAPSYLARSSDWPLTDPGTYVKVCSQTAGKTFADWPAEGADAYCLCMAKGLGEDRAGWARAYHIAWMRADGQNRPDISSRRVFDLHGSCKPG
ncbi:MAG: hypothetical protein HXY25_12325 [Alphaproteobacteria bacterium]|nr:hypothetical protein [Alphaproteobacteria bacterium]